MTRFRLVSQGFVGVAQVVRSCFNSTSNGASICLVAAASVLTAVIVCFNSSMVAAQDQTSSPAPAGTTFSTRAKEPGDIPAKCYDDPWTKWLKTITTTDPIALANAEITNRTFRLMYFDSQHTGYGASETNDFTGRGRRDRLDTLNLWLTASESKQQSTASFIVCDQPGPVRPGPPGVFDSRFDALIDPACFPQVQKAIDTFAYRYNTYLIDHPEFPKDRKCRRIGGPTFELYFDSKFSETSPVDLSKSGNSWISSSCSQDLSGYWINILKSVNPVKLAEREVEEQTFRLMKPQQLAVSTLDEWLRYPNLTPQVDAGWVKCEKPVPFRLAPASVFGMKDLFGGCDAELLNLRDEFVYFYNTHLFMDPRYPYKNQCKSIQRPDLAGKTPDGFLSIKSQE